MGSARVLSVTSRPTTALAEVASASTRSRLSRISHTLPPTASPRSTTLRGTRTPTRPEHSVAIRAGRPLTNSQEPAKLARTRSRTAAPAASQPATRTAARTAMPTESRRARRQKPQVPSSATQPPSARPAGPRRKPAHVAAACETTEHETLQSLQGYLTDAAPAALAPPVRRGSRVRTAPAARPPRVRTPRVAAGSASANAVIAPAAATALTALVATTAQSTTPPMALNPALITPENTIFVSLCFEGPDLYATAGGLGTRVTAFTESLARQGYDTYLFFVGDPYQPAVEARMGGKLQLRRWCQWLSRSFPHGVYDGEESKHSDYTSSIPPYVCDHIAAPALAEGKRVVVIAEDWHTAETMCRLSDLLHARGLRQGALLLWNCNSLISLHRVDWARLNFTSTITTVSRYMKHALWDYGVNPLVIPNGIPRHYLAAVPEAETERLRALLRWDDPERLILFKMGRFDPDKRWLMAIEAAARLKASGHPISLLVRGGMEPHGAEVLRYAAARGLRVRDVEAERPTCAEVFDLLRAAGEADVYNLRFFVPPEIGRLCYAAADATLANSGHEPFGLVGLEVMAAGGIAFTGATGEDYAVSFENAVALETDDPDELVGYLLHLQQHPAEGSKIRKAGPQTAAIFRWEDAIENLVGKLSYLARKQLVGVAQHV